MATRTEATGRGWKLDLLLSFLIIAAPAFAQPIGQTGPTTKVDEVAVTDALNALEALESATRAGLLYRDYVARVADAQARVDRAVRLAPNTQSAKYLQIALEDYRRASTWWQAKIYRELEFVRRMREHAAQESCSALSDLLTRTPEEWNQWRRAFHTEDEKGLSKEARALGERILSAPDYLQTQADILTLSLSVPALWQCASEAITRAREQ